MIGEYWRYDWQIGHKVNHDAWQHFLQIWFKIAVYTSVQRLSTLVEKYGSWRLKLSPSRGEAGEKLQCHSDIPIGTERYFDWTLTEGNICGSLNWRGREKVGAVLWGVLFCNYGCRVIWFLLQCWTKLSVSMQSLQIKDYRLENKSRFNDST